MKILETLNNGMKKIAKGMFALFTINLLIFGGILLIQSCQTEDVDFHTENQELALQKFENLLSVNTPIIRKTIEMQKENILLSKSNNSDKIRKKNEKEAKEVLLPIINGSMELFHAFDLNDKDMKDILNGADSSTIAVLGLTFFSYKKEPKYTNNSANIDLFNSIIGIQTTNAQDWGAVGGCASAALGLDSLSTLKEALEGKKVTRKALRKAFGVVAKKFAKAFSGWGGMIMAAEFAICVGAAHAF